MPVIDRQHSALSLTVIAADATIPPTIADGAKSKSVSSAVGQNGGRQPYQEAWSPNYDR